MDGQFAELIFTIHHSPFTIHYTTPLQVYHKYKVMATKFLQNRS